MIAQDGAQVMLGVKQKKNREREPESNQQGERKSERLRWRVGGARRPCVAHHGTQRFLEHWSHYKLSNKYQYYIINVCLTNSASQIRGNAQNQRLQLGSFTETPLGLIQLIDILGSWVWWYWEIRNRSRGTWLSFGVCTSVHQSIHACICLYKIHQSDYLSQVTDDSGKIQTKQLRIYSQLVL